MDHVHSPERTASRLVATATALAMLAAALPSAAQDRIDEPGEHVADIVAGLEQSRWVALPTILPLFEPTDWSYLDLQSGRNPGTLGPNSMAESYISGRNHGFGVTIFGSPVSPRVTFNLTTGGPNAPDQDDFRIERIMERRGVALDQTPCGDSGDESSGTSVWTAWDSAGLTVFKSYFYESPGAITYWVEVPLESGSSDMAYISSRDAAKAFATVYCHMDSAL